MPTKPSPNPFESDPDWKTLVGLASKFGIREKVLRTEASRTPNPYVLCGTCRHSAPLHGSELTACHVGRCPCQQWVQMTT